MVDDAVVVHAGHDVGRVVVGALAAALGDGLGVEPAVGAGEAILGVGDEPEELDVAAGEQVEAAVDVDDALAGARAGRLQEGPEGALLLARVLGLGRVRRRPEPHGHAGAAAGRVGGVLAQPLGHGGALVLAPTPRRQRLLQRPHEVRARAQQHAPHQVRRRDAGRPLDHLEAARLLDEPVAVLAAPVRRDVVPVHHELAAEAADEVQLRHVRRVRHRPRHPAAGLHGREPGARVSGMPAARRGGEQEGGAVEEDGRAKKNDEDYYFYFDFHLHFYFFKAVPERAMRTVLAAS